MKFGTDSSSNLETAHSLKELDAGPLKFHFTPFVDKMVILTLFNTIMHFIYILFVIYLYLYPESFTFKDIYLFEIKGVEWGPIHDMYGVNLKMQKPVMT